MRKLESLWQWKYVSVMIGALMGYTLAVTTESISPFPGLIYHEVWTVSGAALGALAYWTLSRRNSN